MGQIQGSINQLLGTLGLFQKIGSIEKGISKLTPEEESGLKWSEEQEAIETANTNKYGNLPDLRPNADDGGIQPPAFNRGDMGPYESGFGAGSHQQFLADQEAFKTAQALDVEKATQGDQIATMNTQKHIYKASDNFRRTRQRINRAKHGAKGGK